MQENKKKNKETKIGKIIYGFLLFMPLLAIGITCGYAIFNKNAYKSYTDKSYQNVETLADFHYEQTYLYRANTIKQGGIYENSSKIIGKNLFYNAHLYENVNIWFYGENNQNIRLYVKDVDSNINIINYGIVTNYDFTFQFVSTSFDVNQFNYVRDYFKYQIEHTIDNVFYYSIDKVQQSPLFNWSQDTLIYNTVETFTTALNINNSFFPQLMTYWLIITAAYLVYDIGLLMLLVCHRKIHELGDNI